MPAPYCKWQDQRLCIIMEVMQCDICQGGLESIYLQKKESPELENERPRWSFLLLEGEYKFWGWVWEMSQGKWGKGWTAQIFPDASRPILIWTSNAAREPHAVCRTTRATAVILCVLPALRYSLHQRDDGDLTSPELMHDLYQFHMSCTLMFIRLTACLWRAFKCNTESNITLRDC